MQGVETPSMILQVVEKNSQKDLALLKTLNAPHSRMVAWQTEISENLLR